MRRIPPVSVDQLRGAMEAYMAARHAKLGVIVKELEEILGRFCPHGVRVTVDAVTDRPAAMKALLERLSDMFAPALISSKRDSLTVRRLVN